MPVTGGRSAVRKWLPTLIVMMILVAAAAVVFVLTRPAPAEGVKIGDIIGDPSGYAGRVVTIDCKYGGWSYGGDVAVTDMGPQVTKSDWCVYDETGGIYVQANGGAEILESSYSGALMPTDQDCIGVDLVIRGTVRISDEGVPYIG